MSTPNTNLDLIGVSEKDMLEIESYNPRVDDFRGSFHRVLRYTYYSTYKNGVTLEGGVQSVRMRQWFYRLDSGRYDDDPPHGPSYRWAWVINLDEHRSGHAELRDYLDAHQGREDEIPKYILDGIDWDAAPRVKWGKDIARTVNRGNTPAAIRRLLNDQAADACLLQEIQKRLKYRDDLFAQVFSRAITGEVNNVRSHATIARDEYTSTTGTYYSEGWDEPLYPHANV